MRNLVTVREVNAVLPIEGKDRIELAKVDGWQAITQKGKFSPGQFAIYIEIDALLPLDNPAFEFLRKKPDQTHHRLKTMKMGGVLSQGLLLRLDDAGMEGVRDAYFLDDKEPKNHFGLASTKEEGGVYYDDPENDPANVGRFAKVLGITKYEPPQTPEERRGLGRVITFPGFIPRSDQERCQNLKIEIQDAVDSKDVFEVTEKLDGKSITVYTVPLDKNLEQIKIGVCSRNQEIELNPDGPGEYWDAARKAQLDTVAVYLTQLVGGSIALQGELVGPGIQSNRLKLAEKQVFVYDIYSVPHARYLLPHERHLLLTMVKFKLGLEVPHVPVVVLQSFLKSVEDLLADVETMGKLVDHPFEGVVFKSQTGGLTFKVINNQYLLANDE
jgi:RNA ligase (TIGR02306 family)